MPSACVSSRPVLSHSQKQSSLPGHPQRDAGRSPLGKQSPQVPQHLSLHRGGPDESTPPPTTQGRHVHSHAEIEGIEGHGQVTCMAYHMAPQQPPERPKFCPGRGHDTALVPTPGKALNQGWYTEEGETRVGGVVSAHLWGCIRVHRGVHILAMGFPGP